MDRCIHILEKLLCALSREQNKRVDETETVMKNLVENTFGKDAEEMVVINSLATHPSVRGRGYGGALVEYVSQRADADKRSTFLYSSNPANTKFYNNHGYFEIATAFFGESDAYWKAPAVPCPLFFRKCIAELDAKSS